jgi:radical SAM protein (TIGR01212 family)
VRRYGAHKFILYFQAHTGTYAPVGRLREIYDHALSVRPFQEMIVSTRPDCVPAEVAALLASYRREGLDVWVELGVQSMHDRSLRRVNRHHTAEDSRAAVERLRHHGLKVAVHVIFGIPGEDDEGVIDSIRGVAGLRPDGIKIHNLHIIRGTALCQEYLRGEVVVPGPERHLALTVRALQYLPKQTIVMRMTTDSPVDQLVAPRHFWGKAMFYRRVCAEMARSGVCQGSLNSDIWESA